MPHPQDMARHSLNASETVEAISTSSAQQPSSQQVKKRRSRRSAAGPTAASSKMDDRLSDERQPLVDPRDNSTATEPLSWTARNQWIVLALASGACAAFNGAFAKLTTTELTTSFAKAAAGLLHLSHIQNVIEVIVRSMFFGLNLVFNGVMWTLFTKALTRGNSTTQVSIINTSSNFVITAILGVAIFSESLPPLWWLGAAMLVAGNVIIGQKDEGSKDSSSSSSSIKSTASSRPTSPDSSTEGAQGTYHRIPGVEEPVFIPRDEKDDDDVLDLETS